MMANTEHQATGVTVPQTVPELKNTATQSPSSPLARRTYTDDRTGIQYVVVDHDAENTGHGLLPPVFIPVDSPFGAPEGTALCEVSETRISRDALAAWATAILAELGEAR